jgi:hypothetical protein
VSNRGLEDLDLLPGNLRARSAGRISSSLFPLNMLPTMTSIQPWLG